MDILYSVHHSFSTSSLKCVSLCPFEKIVFHVFYYYMEEVKMCTVHKVLIDWFSSDMRWDLKLISFSNFPKRSKRIFMQNWCIEMCALICVLRFSIFSSSSSFRFFDIYICISLAYVDTETFINRFNIRCHFKIRINEKKENRNEKETTFDYLF